MVFKRIRDLVVATVNEGIDRMEDPIIMINQYLRDMEEELEMAHHSVVRHKSLEQNFKQRQEEAERMSEKRFKQAHLAMDAGNEDLGKKALYEKKHYDERATYYKNLYEKATVQVQELLEGVSKLKSKYEELRDRKVALVARANAAKTKGAIQVSLQKSHHHHTLKDFERLEGRIRDMEVRVNLFGGETVQPKADPFKALENEDEIEQTLELMREERKKNQASNLEKKKNLPDQEAL